MIPMVSCLEITAGIGCAEVMMSINCDDFHTFLTYALDIFIIHSRLLVLRRKVKNLLQLLKRIRNLHPPLLVQVSDGSASAAI